MELFYGNLRFAPLLLPIGILYHRHRKKGLILKKEQQFELQFQDALQSLEAQLSTGYSMENAIREVQKELQMIYTSTDMIIKEFTLMTRQLNLNLTTEEVWKLFARRVQSNSVNSFITVLIQSKRSGGDSIKIIRKAIDHLRERVRINQEMQTVIAAKRLEFRIMTLIPFGIIAYIRISFPEFIETLYGTLFGKGFMSVCLLVYLFAWKMGNRIVEIEV